jgi:hypothetical protein
MGERAHNTQPGPNTADKQNNTQGEQDAQRVGVGGITLDRANGCDSDHQNQARASDKRQPDDQRV